MEIFLFIIGTIGMTHIVVDSKIFAPIRKFLSDKYPTSLGTLISCYVCSGFWCGIISGFIAFNNISYTQILLAGFSSSFLANLAAIFMNYLEASTFINMPPEERK